MAAEDTFDEIMALIDGINQKLEKKQLPVPNIEKKNSHLHMMIETSLMEKVGREAREEGVSIAERVRQKLRESEQLNRIEVKLDRLLLRIK